MVEIIFGPSDGVIPAALGGTNICGFSPMGAGTLARYMGKRMDSVAGERQQWASCDPGSPRCSGGSLGLGCNGSW